MAQILNIASLHNNGASELIVGIRGNQFKLARDPDSDTVTLTDPLTNKQLIINSSVDGSITKEELINILGFIPLSREEVQQMIIDAIR